MAGTYLYYFVLRRTYNYQVLHADYGKVGKAVEGGFGRKITVEDMRELQHGGWNHGYCERAVEFGIPLPVEEQPQASKNAGRGGDDDDDDDDESGSYTDESEEGETQLV